MVLSRAREGNGVKGREDVCSGGQEADGHGGTWLALCLSSVLYFLDWLRPKPFHCFLEHGQNKTKSQAALPPWSRLKELDATFSSKGSLAEVVE